MTFTLITQSSHVPFSGTYMAAEKHALTIGATAITWLKDNIRLTTHLK